MSHRCELWCNSSGCYINGEYWCISVRFCIKSRFLFCLRNHFWCTLLQLFIHIRFNVSKQRNMPDRLSSTFPPDFYLQGTTLTHFVTHKISFKDLSIISFFFLIRIDMKVKGNRVSTKKVLFGVITGRHNDWYYINISAIYQETIWLISFIQWQYLRHNVVLHLLW